MGRRMAGAVECSRAAAARSPACGAASSSGVPAASSSSRRGRDVGQLVGRALEAQLAAQLVRDLGRTAATCSGVICSVRRRCQPNGVWTGALTAPCWSANAAAVQAPLAGRPWPAGRARSAPPCRRTCAAATWLKLLPGCDLLGRTLDRRLVAERAAARSSAARACGTGPHARIVGGPQVGVADLDLADEVLRRQGDQRRAAVLRRLVVLGVRGEVGRELRRRLGAGTSIVAASTISAAPRALLEALLEQLADQEIRHLDRAGQGIDQIVADHVAAQGLDVVRPRSCPCCAAEGRSGSGRTRPCPGAAGRGGSSRPRSRPPR